MKRTPPSKFEVLKDLEPVIGDGVVLEAGDTLPMKPVDWLWPFWIAKGKVHLLAGAPGQGKTTIALAIAAIITIGGKFPDGASCELGSVVIWSGEDDPADTLKPRLIAAGADISRVHFITGSIIGGRTATFNPARDMDALLAAVNEIGDVQMLILDPMVSAITGDSHKNTEVRKDMQPLVDWAADSGAAIFGITHLSKGGKGADPAQRVLGSVAFVAVARVVMVAGKVEGDAANNRRVLARSKSNIGPDGGGVEYRIDQIEVASGIHASRVIWGETVQGSAKDLLTPGEESRGSALEAAQDFISKFLGDDLVPSNSVWEAGQAAGHAIRTLRRAAKVLKVTLKKTRDGWFMGLPKDPEAANEDRAPSSPYSGPSFAGDLKVANEEGAQSWPSWPTSGPLLVEDLKVANMSKVVNEDRAQSWSSWPSSGPSPVGNESATGHEAEAVPALGPEAPTDAQVAIRGEPTSSAFDVASVSFVVDSDDAIADQALQVQDAVIVVDDDHWWERS